MMLLWNYNCHIKFRLKLSHSVTNFPDSQLHKQQQAESISRSVLRFLHADRSITRMVVVQSLNWATAELNHCDVLGRERPHSLWPTTVFPAAVFPPVLLTCPQTSEEH